MTAIAMPNLDRKTVDELRNRMPDLSELELPNLQHVGRSAEATIDRLLGRSRAPIWPWIAAGIGLVAVIGVIAAYFAWLRRPAVETTGDTWAPEPEAWQPETETTDVVGAVDEA